MINGQAFLGKKFKRFETGTCLKVFEKSYYWDCKISKNKSIAKLCQWHEPV